MRSPMLCNLAVVGVLALGAISPVLADTKSEMITVMETIAENKAGAESVVDWDHLVVKAPQTKGQDIAAQYKAMDATNKAAFRKSFLAGFSSSFKRASGGRKFSDAAKEKGMITVNDTPPHPTMLLHPKGGGKDIKLLFSRIGKQLKFQGIDQT